MPISAPAPILTPAIKPVLSVIKRPRRGLNTETATPFVKWAGGKRALMPALMQHLPQDFRQHLSQDFPQQFSKDVSKRNTTYWEPFLGGGAMFFQLAPYLTNAVLSDTNQALMDTYWAVQNHVDALIEMLEQHTLHHAEDGYYWEVRKLQPQNLLETAARFIYLNKTCYNGLYRVNKKGHFNVPKGRYKKPMICDRMNLKAANLALQKATLLRGSFAEVVQPQQNDFVYCDPPYDQCFNAYQAEGFDASMQQQLHDVGAGWANKGANVMLSNAATPRISQLYQDQNQWQMHLISAPRFINANASARGKTNEWVITSYAV